MGSFACSPIRPTEGRSGALLISIARLRRFCESGGHEFWPDSLSLADAARFDSPILAGHRQLTDVYLLALACSRKGCLATFDRSIPIRAVKGASARDLAIIEPAD